MRDAGTLMRGGGLASFLACTRTAAARAPPRLTRGDDTCRPVSPLCRKVRLLSAIAPADMDCVVEVNEVGTVRSRS